MFRFCIGVEIDVSLIGVSIVWNVKNKIINYFGFIFLLLLKKYDLVMKLKEDEKCIVCYDRDGIEIDIYLFLIEEINFKIFKCKVVIYLRLNKFISESGKVLRWGVDKLISEGRVIVNGKVVKVGD